MALRIRRYTPKLSSLSRSFPTVEACPLPSGCACAETPPGLDIDCQTPLAGTAPWYNRHVVLCTGKDNWPSRIEDEDENGTNLAKKLKQLVGPKGPLYHQKRNTMVTNTSIAPWHWTPWHWTDKHPHFPSAYLFPEFQYVARVDPNEDVHLAYLAGAIRSSSKLATSDTMSRQLHEIVVFICGHGTRDIRCGIMGPLLKSEFQRSLTGAGFQLPGAADNVAHSSEILLAKLSRRSCNATVGLVSHIGGHTWAGNVILYIPPTFTTEKGLSPLAGIGIWYGRVEPKHVEGIVMETILGGRVIEELFRGGIDRKGETLRLDEDLSDDHDIPVHVKPAS